jgi:hypothetical protein
MVQSNIPNARIGTSSRWLIALVLFLAIGAFLLLSEHRAHGFYLLLWLLILACPLLHLWMHGGQGHGSRGDQVMEASREEDRGAHQH